MKTNNTYKIFIVDDDPFCYSMFEQHIRNLGYSDITVYDNGQDCLNHLVDQPDIIFLDHEMGLLKGLDVLKKIKRFSPEIYIVFVSSQEDMNVAISALKYGAFDYIIKGTGDLEKFTKVIEKVTSVISLTEEKKTSGLNKIASAFLPGKMSSISELAKKMHLLLLLPVILLMFSCKTQNLFTELPDQAKDPAAFIVNQSYEYKIQVDDKINISVWDHDDLSVGSVYGIYNSNEVYGKWLLVNADGVISIPEIGPMEVEGLTVIELQDNLKEVYGKYITKPIVDVKVLNKEVTVMGEVKSPGKISMEKNQNSLVDIIAQAGDFDFYADKRKVSVMRMVGGELKTMTIDMTKMKNYTAENILIQPDDVIYVPSRGGKTFDKRATNIIIISSIVTSLVLIVQLFR